MSLKKGDIVTVPLMGNSSASNTYIVSDILDDICFLHHPLFPECFVSKPVSDLNHAAPKLKDSSERCLDFAVNHKDYLDYNTLADLESLCLYFVVRRKITPRQKGLLSNLCGIVASIHFNNDITAAMSFIVENQGLLDDFNAMWFNNFKGLFNGVQRITSKKQRSAIFNMAGFILAELATPIINK